MITLRPIILLVLLAGCAPLPDVLPEDYAGDVATIEDSFDRLGGTKANLYYVRSVDGQPIANGYNATMSASSYNGMAIELRRASRTVPIRAMRLEVVGVVTHGAPIGYIFGAGSNYRVEGVLTFLPETNALYRVRGTLDEMYSAVWIEDDNGYIVSEVVQKIGDDDAEVEIVEFDKADTRIRAAGKNQSRSEYFLAIANGDSAETVIGKLGQPEDVVQYAGGASPDKSASVTFVYKNLGTVQFSAAESGARSVMLVKPVDRRIGPSSSIIEQLYLAEGQTFRNIARHLFNLNPKDTGTLDMLAQRIWERKDSNDKIEIDALAYLCKTLAQSGNARYRSLLGEIGEQAQSRKLREYAEDSLEQLPVTGATQFEPAIR